MLKDVCWQYETFANLPIPGNIDPGCANTKTTWRSHEDEFYSTQRGRDGDGGLEAAIRCYESKGHISPQNMNPYVDPDRYASQRCDRSNPTYVAALAWRKGTLSAPPKNRRNGGAQPPPKPAPFTSSPAVPVPAPPTEVPVFGTPGAPTTVDIPVVSTPGAPDIAIERLPEPPSPNGRGHNVPARANCGTLCDVLMLGVATAMCAPVGVGVAITLPKVVPAAGAICATNPQLCPVTP